jgi:hypothetical protein
MGITAKRKEVCQVESNGQAKYVMGINRTKIEIMPQRIQLGIRVFCVVAS